MVREQRPSAAAIPEKILEIAGELRKQDIDWENATTLPAGAAALLAWALQAPERLALIERWQRADDSLRTALHQMPVPPDALARSLAVLSRAQAQMAVANCTSPSIHDTPSNSDDQTMIGVGKELEQVEDELRLQPLDSAPSRPTTTESTGGRSEKRFTAAPAQPKMMPTPPTGSGAAVDWQRFHQKYERYQLKSPRTWAQYSLGFLLAALLLAVLGIGTLQFLKEQPPESIATLAEESRAWRAEQTRNVVWENNWQMFSTTFPLCDGIKGQPSRARQFQSKFGKVTVFDYSPTEVRPAFLFVINSDQPFQLPESLPRNPNFRNEQDTMGGFLSHKYVYLFTVEGDTEAYKALLTIDASVAR